MMIIVVAVECCSARAHRPPSHPNIVLMMSDDQGWGDVSYATQAYQRAEPWTVNRPRTPHLDAMASSNHTIVFHRFYAGSAVCSPTRSAVLTGRSPDRECIYNANPHGFGPAWECSSALPLPPTTYTIAEAASDSGYATIHIGKWHLGEMFPKTSHGTPSYAYKKWPVSNPGQHGFERFHSTEASAPSSTLNCGCNFTWPIEAPGCIIGGGEWRNDSFKCMNYWRPTDLSHFPSDDTTDSGTLGVVPKCRNCATATADCVTNLTSKIQGDDSEHIVDTFESFLDAEGWVSTINSGTRQQEVEGRTRMPRRPFFAVLWLHTVHEPHVALPEFYHNYTDSFGDPARDYLGSVTQMDVQVGRVRRILADRGVSHNTMLWFTSDNGPHTTTSTSGPRDRSTDPAYAATNGLRQCKASLYEGGIRVPGLLEWPAIITRNAKTWHPAYVSDYLPTVLDVFNKTHPQATWYADGMSLLPLIALLGSSGAVNDTSQRPSNRPLVFKFNSQAALIDNEWKVLENPNKGLCKAQHGSQYSGIRLFNLNNDPTESVDCSTDPQYAEIFRNLSARLADFKASLRFSQVNESQCEPPSKQWSQFDSTGVVVDQIMPACIGPGGHNHPKPSPAPSPPLGPPFTLTAPDGAGCLTASNVSERSSVVTAPCVMGDKKQEWQAGRNGQVMAAGGGGLCLKPLVQSCARQTVWLGSNCVDPHGMALVNDTVKLIQPCTPLLCLGPTAVTAPCAEASQHGWVAHYLLK